jgi:hypothetical protein
MARLLSPVLSPFDFPSAELSAILLDGEAYRVGQSVAPIDEVPGPLMRAAALSAELPPRLIAEQHTAAWIWGAQPYPPERHEVCADTAARLRPALDASLAVREVVIRPEDTRLVGDLMVTSPLRTAIDLARFVDHWTDEEAAVIASLLRLGDVTLEDCARSMNLRRNLPRKRRALERLAGLARIDPVDVVDGVDPSNRVEHPV